MKRLCSVLLFLQHTFAMACCCEANNGAADFDVTSTVVIAEDRVTANISLTFKVCSVSDTRSVSLGLREVEGGGNETCQRLSHQSSGPTSVLNFTCSNLQPDKAFEVLVTNGDIPAKDIPLLYTTSVQSVKSHTSGNKDGLVEVQCTFARGASCRGCIVELVDLNETDYRNLSIPRNDLTVTSGNVSDLVSGHCYNLTARDWIQDGTYSFVAVPGKVLKVGAPQKYTVYIAVSAGLVVMLVCLFAGIFLLHRRALKRKKYSVTKTESTHYPSGIPPGQPPYVNIPQHLQASENMPLQSQAYENLPEPSNTISPAYQNVFSLQESSSQKSQPAVVLLHYQNVNPCSLQLKSDDFPIPSGTGGIPSSSSSSTSHSISTRTTESTAVSSPITDTSFTAADSVFDNSEDFGSVPTCGSSHQSHPSYGNVFAVSNSINSSNERMEPSLSLQFPPPLPPHTDEMLQEAETVGETATSDSTSKCLPNRVVMDGEDPEIRATECRELNIAERSQNDANSSVLNSDNLDSPSPVPPPLPEHTLLMYCQKLDPNDPTAVRDPDWIMKPPPLIPKYTKEMHQLTDTPEAEGRKKIKKTKPPQRANERIPIPPPFDDDLPSMIEQFKQRRRAGTMEARPLALPEEDSTGSDKMMLGEFLGHNYDEMDPSNSRLQTYLQGKCDLRPPSSYELYDPNNPSGNDPYHFVFNLAYDLRRFKS